MFPFTWNGEKYYAPVGFGCKSTMHGPLLAALMRVPVACRPWLGLVRDDCKPDLPHRGLVLERVQTARRMYASPIRLLCLV